MSMNVNGCSVCPAGEERYERYRSSLGKMMVQYDYRDHDGELFSCVSKTLDECREKRDKWLSKRNDIKH